MYLISFLNLEQILIHKILNNLYYFIIFQLCLTFLFSIIFVIYQLN